MMKSQDLGIKLMRNQTKINEGKVLDYIRNLFSNKQAGPSVDPSKAIESLRVLTQSDQQGRSILGNAIQSIRSLQMAVRLETPNNTLSNYAVMKGFNDYMMLLKDIPGIASGASMGQYPDFWKVIHRSRNEQEASNTLKGVLRKNMDQATIDQFFKMIEPSDFQTLKAVVDGIYNSNNAQDAIRIIRDLSTAMISGNKKDYLSVDNPFFREMMSRISYIPNVGNLTGYIKSPNVWKSIASNGNPTEARLELASMYSDDDGNVLQVFLKNINDEDYNLLKSCLEKLFHSLTARCENGFGQWRQQEHQFVFHC